MENIGLYISYCISGGSLVIAFLVYHNSNTKDIKEGTKEGVIISTKIDMIFQSLNSISSKMDKYDDKLSGLDEKVTRIDESTKQAHLRINEIKGEMK